MPTLLESPEVKKVLANHLAQCFDIFPLYGREPEAVVNINKGFNLVLSDCTSEQISGAFKYHLTVFKEFPMPADIYQIIHRGNKPPFERSVYITISKKNAEDRAGDDWEYMREYERFMKTGNY